MKRNDMIATIVGINYDNWYFLFWFDKIKYLFKGICFSNLFEVVKKNILSIRKLHFINFNRINKFYSAFRNSLWPFYVLPFVLYLELSYRINQTLKAWILAANNHAQNISNRLLNSFSCTRCVFLYLIFYVISMDLRHLQL